MAAPVFCCGFECGVSGAHWNLSGANPPVFSTTTKRTGARALSVSPTGGTSQAAIVGIATGSNKFVARFYYLKPDLTTANTDIFGAIDSTGFFTGLSFNNATDRLHIQLSTVEAGSGISIVANKWYRIDMKIDISANPWTCSLSVDGVEDTGSNPIGAGTFTGVFTFGTTSAVNPFFVDDFIFSQTLADYPIGNGVVWALTPTSDGTHNIAGTGDFQRTLTGTDILNATTTAYQLVDDVPLESSPVDWINMIAPPNATDYVECKFGPAPGVPTPGDTPRAIEVVMGIHQAGTGAGNMLIQFGIPAELINAYSATGVAGVTTIAYKRVHVIPGDFPNIAAGVKNGTSVFRFRSPAAVDANPDQYLDCIMIEAEFAEPKQQSKIVINQSVQRATLR